MRPVLLRPPDLVRPSVSALTGLPLYSSERSTSTSWRRPGEVGLYVFSAIALRSLRAPSSRRCDWPSASVTIAFLTSDRWPRRAAERLVLPLRTIVLTALTLTLNSVSTAALISAWWRRAHAEHDLVVLGSRVAFSVITGARMMS